MKSLFIAYPATPDVKAVLSQLAFRRQSSILSPHGKNAWSDPYQWVPGGSGAVLSQSAAFSKGGYRKNSSVAARSAAASLLETASPSELARLLYSISRYPPHVYSWNQAYAKIGAIVAQVMQAWTEYPPSAVVSIQAAHTPIALAAKYLARRHNIPSVELQAQHYFAPSLVPAKEHRQLVAAPSQCNRLGLYSRFRQAVSAQLMSDAAIGPDYLRTRKRSTTLLRYRETAPVVLFRQVEPELVVNPLGSGLGNQDGLEDAAEMKYGNSLVVRAHPGQLSRSAGEFFVRQYFGRRRAYRFNRIRLTHAGSRSSVVPLRAAVSMGGSALLDAALAGIPVFNFAHVWFEDVPRLDVRGRLPSLESIAVAADAARNEASDVRDSLYSLLMATIPVGDHAFFDAQKPSLNLSHNEACEIAEQLNVLLQGIDLSS